MYSPGNAGLVLLSNVSELTMILNFWWEWLRSGQLTVTERGSSLLANGGLFRSGSVPLGHLT